MPRRTRKFLAYAASFTLSLGISVQAKPAKVELLHSAESWKMHVNGHAFPINGAGLEVDTTHVDSRAHLVADTGGNSIRNWHVEDAARSFAAADKYGLMLTQGIALGEHLKMDYKAPVQLEKQRARVREAVLRWRDQPALLLWGLGNEMEFGEPYDDADLWREMEHLARMVKSLDPQHPVMTVVAEINPQKIRTIMRYAPAIDILGINAYGSAPSVAQRLHEYGWTKPFVLTEFGPRGPWETKKTSWGAPYEDNSSARTLQYRQAWNKNVSDASCLGSYAFLWGNKWEGTSTWFGMLLPGTEERTAAVDLMQEFWTGHAAEHPVPELLSFASDVDGKELAPSSQHSAIVKAKGSNLHYRYEVRAEAGRSENEEAPLCSECIPEEATGSQLKFTAPRLAGAYRLYVFISDANGGGATANLPFFVRKK